MVSGALADLDAEFAAIYTELGRPSIVPERLIRASLVQILFSIQSKRQLMEQVEYRGVEWFRGRFVLTSVASNLTRLPQLLAE